MTDIQIDRLPRIHWNGFLDSVEQPRPDDHEAVAWLFSTAPYSRDEEWHVREIDVIPTDFDGDGFTEGWKPEKKSLAKVKRAARKDELTDIGNIHTHPEGPAWEDAGLGYGASPLPSDTDLKYMRKFRQVVRGVIVVDYSTVPVWGHGSITELVFHNQYGKIIGRWELIRGGLPP